MKRLAVLFLSTLLLLSLLTGCGSKSAATDSAASGDFNDSNFIDDSQSGLLYWDGGESLTDSTPAALPEGVKMIHRATLDVQTLDYETSERAITELVGSCGGYFENRSLSNYSGDYRYGEFTVRVPAAEYTHFCQQVGEMCHVTYFSSSAENITEAYYDTDSRLKTAQIKLERLQSLLAQASSMDDIITIESAISDTEYEIESLSGTLRHYDALVDYATVSLTLNEVYRLSGSETAPTSFGERIFAALSNGLHSAGSFFEELLIALAGAWVFLLLLAVFVLIAVRIARRRKHSRMSSQAAEPPTQKNQNNE